VPLAPFEFSHLFLSLLLQHLSQGSVNMPELQAEVTRAWEAAATMDVARVVVALVVETST
jgi:hypothetical protein